MRILSTKRLKNFWENPNYSDSKDDLEVWVSIVKKANWQNTNEVVSEFPSADNVGNKRIIFNIKGNKYRLIVLFRYDLQRVYIRFIGTHKEYDKIEDIKNI